MNMIINGKSYKEYLAEKKKLYGTLHIKHGKQVQKIANMTIENTYKDSDMVLGDGDFLMLGDGVLEKDGKTVILNGRIEFKDGVWYENGEKVNI